MKRYHDGNGRWIRCILTIFGSPTVTVTLRMIEFLLNLVPLPLHWIECYSFDWDYSRPQYGVAYSITRYKIDFFGNTTRTIGYILNHFYFHVKCNDQQQQQAWCPSFIWLLKLLPNILINNQRNSGLLSFLRWFLLGKDECSTVNYTSV